MLRKLLNWRPTDRRMAIFAVLAMAFVTAQSFGALHAAKFGDDPHDHNGAPCIVSVYSKSGDKFLTAATVAFIAVIITWRASAAVAQTERARIGVRAARPRGPPTH